MPLSSEMSFAEKFVMSSRVHPVLNLILDHMGVFRQPFFCYNGYVAP